MSPTDKTIAADGNAYHIEYHAPEGTYGHKATAECEAGDTACRKGARLYLGQRIPGAIPGGMNVAAVSA